MNTSKIQEFKLVLSDDVKHPTIITFDSNLLQYFTWFNEVYTLDTSYTVFKEDANFVLAAAHWEYIIQVYREHAALYDNEEGLKEPIMPLNRDYTYLDKMALFDLYSMVRTLNYYDMSLMLDLVLATLLKRLFKMSRSELFSAHPDAIVLNPQDIYVKLLVEHPFERITMNYNIRKQEMLAIFKQYIAVNDIVALIANSFMPQTRSVLACGNAHIMVLTQPDTLFGYGDNSCGQLGRAQMNRDGSLQPWGVSKLKDVISVWCGASHTLMLKTSGLYVSGLNESGQLGIPGTAHGQNMYAISEPICIDLNEDVLSAACGHIHSVILTRETVYGCGRNEFGQLGNGLTISAHSPQPMHFKDRVKVIAVACGNNYSLMLTSEGKVYGCGENGFGVLGVDPKKERRMLSPQLIKMPAEDIEIISMAAGPDHALFIDTNGRVFVIGENAAGQLGIGNTRDTYIVWEVYPSTRPTIAVSAGYGRSFFINEERSLYACGWNRDNLIGWLLEDQAVRPIRVPKFKEVLSVSCGGDFTAILTGDGLFMLGYKRTIDEPPQKVDIWINQLPICLSIEENDEVSLIVANTSQTTVL